MRLPIFFLAAGSVLITAGANAAILFDTSSALSLSNPTQLGRLSRQAVPQDWSGGESFPGVLNTTTTYHYTVYTIPVGLANYIQIDFDSVSANTFVSAYQNSYTPDSVTTGSFGFNTNWLGDAGSSGDYFGTDPVYFQVIAPLNGTLVVVVNNTAASNVGVGDPFHLTVEGYSDSSFDDPPAVPEPGTISLFAGGAVLLLGPGRKFLRKLY